jgi:serine/threonine protein kinase
MGTAPIERRKPSVTDVRDLPQSGPRPLRGYEPGEIIGEKYRLIRPLGQGGMGMVWVAHNTVLDVHCAIKLIDLEGSNNAEDLAQRLLGEARAAAKLGHASIVRVHDFGKTIYGDPFLAMELLDGEDLADVLARDEKLEAAGAVQLMLPIAHALWTAHEKGIVHRDVKPENIFLTKDEEVAIQPKLLDFGIARMLDKPRKITVEGSVVGTPDYMSPEQARGERPGLHTDMWSYCVVLYELIVGSTPFHGANYNALLRSIIEEPPASLAGRGGADEQLWNIIEKGLRKNVDDRWLNMRDLGEQLALWLVERGVNEDITGTSLQRAWLRDPDSSGKIDISTLARLPTDVRAVTGSGLLSPPKGGTASAPSGPDLQALADLAREGDPVEQLQRAERRRAWKVVLTLLVLVLIAALGVLMGTGIIVP